MRGRSADAYTQSVGLAEDEAEEFWADGRIAVEVIGPGEYLVAYTMRTPVSVYDMVAKVRVAKPAS